METIFTKIINGEIPGTFVWRDETCVAFLDIAPVAYGHTLIVPVAQVDKWTDLDPATWAHLNQVAQTIGQAIIEVFGSQRAAHIIAGFDVPHTHIHCFPANSMADYNFANAIAPDRVDEEKMRRAAAGLRRVLGTGEDGYPLA
ncbi:HIT family protein [Corynebacterium mendelii]|uniref:HIT family protein n=1 Tax=Corynebacterium mendelii TaxID=2765362 RepID=A0A939E150_9CORY|nr:HIT family protein [Corynebacterium mendelii]MBN9645055.1 HIT family protein [Corynebacterium mendelii]